MPTVHVPCNLRFRMSFSFFSQLNTPSFPSASPSNTQNFTLLNCPLHFSWLQYYYDALVLFCIQKIDISFFVIRNLLVFIIRVETIFCSILLYNMSVVFTLSAIWLNIFPTSVSRIMIGIGEQVYSALLLSFFFLEVRLIIA